MYAMRQRISAALERLKAFYEDHEPACTAGFFAAGFLFDVTAVGRIDRLHNILHQGLYLTLSGLFTGLELRERFGNFSPPRRFAAAWRYHKGATHFMLGTLLNIYTMFYFKSASLSVSFFFLAFLALLLLVNELKPFKEHGTALRMTLFSLCLVSYFTYLVPLLAGRIGALPFAGSIAAASACAAALAWRLNRRLPEHAAAVRRNLVYPFGAVASLFSLLYFFRLIPPVPLSLSEIGIYHKVERRGASFLLTSTRPRWKFWQRGDQVFLARPGDAVYCWVAVFAPADFTERLAVRWIPLAAGAGEKADEIPLGIEGGRDGGWRGYTVKARYSPGPWRVEIVTSDGRELGRIGLEIVPDASGATRRARVLTR